MLTSLRRPAVLGLLAATAAFFLVLFSASLSAQGGKYTIKTAKLDPPKELKAPIGQLLSPDAIQLLDGAGKTVCDVWLRKEIPADATAEQVKNGLTYRELKETSILAAIRFHEASTDYRKQKIKAGVYTLRLGFQPEDGDHAGVSMSKEFCLLVAADKDAKADPLEPKGLHELSAKSIETGHPGVLMMFPVAKAPATPQLESKENNHWVLNAREAVSVGGQKGAIGIGLVLVGHAAD